MEIGSFLLDPNIAYLVLILTGVLLINAILVPGTGLVELSAMFFLLITAYQVFYMPFNWWALGFIAVGLFPFVIAIRKRERSAMPYLFLSFVLFGIGSIFLYPSEKWYVPAVNPVLAIVTVILAGGYLWLVTRLTIKAWEAPPVQDLGKLIGQSGEARTDIHTSGSVYVNGELWSAISDKPIQAGENIQVIERQGMVLTVVSKPR